MALARDPLPKSAFQPRRVPDRDDDGSGRFSVMTVTFVALLAAAFIYATYNAAPERSRVTDSACLNQNCAMNNVEPRAR
jgi:hypothetical protein